MCIPPARRTLNLVVLLVLLLAALAPRSTAYAQSGGQIVVTPAVLPPSGAELVNPLRVLYRWRDGEKVDVVAGNDDTYDDYERFDWRDLEGATQAANDGEYDFSKIDAQIADAMATTDAAGNPKPRQRLVFGVREQAGSGDMRVPAYLDDDATMYSANGRKYIKWNSQYFLQRRRALFAALGRRYDGDPRVSMIQIMGSQYGEWTGYSPACNDTHYPTLQTKQELVDMVVDNFPTTRLLVGSQDSDIGLYGLQRSPRIGWFRNSLGDSSFNRDLIQNYNPANFGAGSCNRTGTATKWSYIRTRWRTAPVMTEFFYKANPSDITPLLEQSVKDVATWHVSQVSNGNISLPLSAEQAELLRTVGKHSGYRMVLARAAYPSTITAGQSFSLAADWRNDGIAPPYEPWSIVYQLRPAGAPLSSAPAWQGSSAETLENLITQGYDDTTFQKVGPNTPRTVADSFVLPPNVDGGSYDLSVIVCDPSAQATPAPAFVRKPMKLAIEGARSDGSYLLVRLSVEPIVPDAPTPPPTSSPTATTTPSPTATATLAPTLTATPSPTATATATAAPSATPTSSPTATAAPSPTGAPTATSSPSPTLTPTASPSPTATASPTAAPSPTATATPSATPTATPSLTPSPTATATAAPTSAPSPTTTASPTSTSTSTPTATATPTPTGTALPSSTPTQTPTSTLSPSPTATPTPPAASPSPTATPTASRTPTGTQPPTSTPTRTAAPTSTATPTAPPTSTRTATPTSSPTATRTPTLTPSPPPSTTQFETVADSYVRGGAATTNYGTSPSLEVRDGSGDALDHITYLRFDLSSLSATAASRALFTFNVTAIGDTSRPANVSVFAVRNDGWSETGVTWNNRPATSGPALATVAVTAGQGSIDLAPFVSEQLGGDKVVSLALTGIASNNNLVTIASRNNTSGIAKPRLQVTPARRIAQPASADAYVRAGAYQTIRFGTAIVLEMKDAAAADGDRQTFLRFDLRSAGVSSVQRATLRLFYGPLSENRPATVQLYAVASDSWAESTIAWSNRPAIGAQQTALSIPVSQGGWVDFDLTAYVNSQLAVASDNQVSLALLDATLSNSLLTFNSRENTANRPVLELFVP